MADWGTVGNQLTQGYQIGKSTGGKRAGLGGVIAKVADRLRSQREAGEEQGRKINLLGIEGLMKERLLEKEAGLKPTTQPIVDKKGKIVGYRPVGAVFQPSSMGFWDEETETTMPSAQPASILPPAPTGKFNPLRMLPGYASYGGDKRSAYNALRSRGISETEAKRRLGI